MTTVNDDLRLFEAWCAGDTCAGNQLLTRHFDAVYSFFRNKVPDAAEDLTQQTFLACVNNRDSFRREASFRTYLFVIARSRLFNHLRSRARNGDTLDFEETSLEDLGLTPTGAIERRRKHGALVHALRRLPVELQVTLELYYVQGIRGEALHEVLGIPPGTVRSRIRRGLEQLRDRIAELTDAGTIATTVTDLERWAASVRGSLEGLSEGLAGGGDDGADVAVGEGEAQA
jgi:RNA polymerase sigma-70 factor (ECF subfamily)